MLTRRIAQNLTGQTAAILMVSSLAMATPAAAEPFSDLASAVNNARSGSHCPPLQADPMVARVAQMANRETNEYLSHRQPVIPFSDPMPALKTIGYAASEAKLLSGYGTSHSEAIRGLLLTGHATLPDCAYTKYGLDVAEGDGFVMTSVVLAKQ